MTVSIAAGSFCKTSNAAHCNVELSFTITRDADQPTVSSGAFDSAPNDDGWYGIDDEITAEIALS